MKYTAALLTAAAGLALSAPPASAIDFPNLGIFRKKAKPEAAGKAKSLVSTLQSDPDEKKRVQAAEELRSLDPRTNPDVVPALIGAVQKDPSPAVRSEAVDSIGKMKPVSPSAAVALETALQSDPDPKVREAIKAAPWQYHLNGYRPPPGGGSLATQTAEPPFAAPRPAPANPRPGEPGFRPITNAVGKGVVYQPTPEPPLAKPKPAAPKSGPQAVAPPTPSVLPPPLPATAVPEPTPTAKPAAPSVPGGAPAPLPTVPVPPATSPTPASPPASGSLPTVPVPPPAGKSSF